MTRSISYGMRHVLAPWLLLQFLPLPALRTCQSQPSRLPWLLLQFLLLPALRTWHWCQLQPSRLPTWPLQVEGVVVEVELESKLPHQSGAKGGMAAKQNVWLCLGTWSQSASVAEESTMGGATLMS